MNVNQSDTISSKLKIILIQAQAFVERDLHIFFRFKFNAIATIFVPAIVSLGLFGTIFLGLFSSGFAGVSGLDRQDFIAFTLLGALGSTLYSQGQAGISTRFQMEKYWQTVPVLLASPLSTWAMLLGIVISDLAKMFAIVAIFIPLAYFFWPVSIVTIVLVLVLLALLYAMVSGISLIRGAVFLVNENLDPILNYFFLATGYLSCFYFPVSFLPSILQWLAYINPVYFIVYLVRASWLNLPFNLAFALLAVASTAVSMTVGAIAFKKIWRNADITGY